MNKLFIWGTLTTQVNGSGRMHFNKKKNEDIPIGTATIQGIEGEIYEISDKTLKTLDKFERYWGYVRVKIDHPMGELLMYVLSPIHDRYYWKKVLEQAGGGNK